MGVYPLGSQRVGIERDTPTGVTSEFGEPQTTTTVVWVDGCLFEVPQAPEEQQGITVTTSEVGWAILPVNGDAVIPATPPIPFFTVDGTSIDSSARLIHDGLRYVLRGDAVLERDLRGRPAHVFCRCERERG
jgi:hypothetical protein